MSQWLLFALLGTGIGAIYAGLGMGLVTVYKGSGVINFGQASLGLWGAFVFDELTKSGDFVLPLIGVPSRIHLGTSIPLLVAVGLGVLSSAALGGLAHLLIFRPLRHAPVLGKIMGAIGLLTVMQGVILRRFGVETRLVKPVFPQHNVPLAGLSFPQDRLWLLAMVVLGALLLSAYYRWSLSGLATRAGVEDEVALSLARWSPERLAALNWALGSAVTGLFVILAAPITDLNPASVGLLVVPGLAALLIARLSSVGIAALGGLGLGVLQSELSQMQLQSWWPQRLPSGTTDAVPFLVIVVALVALGDRLPTRGSLVLARLPEVVRRRLNAKVVLGAAGVVAAVTPLLGPQDRSALIVSMVLSVIALSFVVLVGLVGQVSLGQAAIAGVAAITLARYTDSLPFPVGLLLAALVSVGAGLVMGVPALRVRGAQLAVVTLAAAVAVEGLLLRNTGADQTTLDSPHLLGLDLSFQRGTQIARIPFTYAVLTVLVLSCLLVSRVLNGATGRRFLAVRSNERAAAAVGVDVAHSKLLAFAVSSFLAGIGGGLLAYSRGAVSVDSFSYFAGISFLLYAFIGGIASVGGALVAGLVAPYGVVYVLVTRLVDLGSSYDIIGGIGMIVAAITSPAGAAGAWGGAFRARLGRSRPQPTGPVAGGPTYVVARERTSARPGPALEVRDLDVVYGGVHAVNRVSLTVRAGELHGLIGPNGAGKTSTLDAMTGFCRSSGTVHVDGRAVTGLPPHKRFRSGVARTWQATELFMDLSVMDNLLVAAAPPRAHDLFTDLVGRTPVRDEDALWALRLLGIAHLAEARPAALSTGQQKLVGVARALASRPAVLLCDEPAAGLDTMESQQLGGHLRAVAESGVAIVLIEHDLSLVLDMCDRVTVLDFGRVIACGTPSQVRNDPEVIAAYVGGGSDSAHGLAALAGAETTGGAT